MGIFSKLFMGIKKNELIKDLSGPAKINEVNWRYYNLQKT